MIGPDNLRRKCMFTSRIRPGGARICSLVLKGAILRAALATSIAKPQYRFSRPSLMASSCAVRFIRQHLLLCLYFWRASNLHFAADQA
jgi:hypothetical protein